MTENKDKNTAMTAGIWAIAAAIGTPTLILIIAVGLTILCCLGCMVAPLVA